MMAFKVIEFGDDPNHAELVKHDDGMIKSFATLAAAELEKSNCQDGVVVCTGLYGPAIFDEHCMIEFLRHSTSLTKEEAKAKFDEYLVRYKEQYEG